MILYLDASALVKRYIQEIASQDVNVWIEAADMVVTGLLTRVEVAAAIARASRMRLITPDETLAALRQFRSNGRACIACRSVRILLCGGTPWLWSVT